MPYVNRCCLIFRSGHIYSNFAFQCCLLYVGLSSLLFLVIVLLLLMLGLTVEYRR